ncbi:MAG TPA: dTMP kinase [Mucilaginibacter sp.]|nr:dTMP kinase [Mucilaginibacter sp.]
MKKNFFFAFEGIDGSGKSTQAKLLKEKLEAQGHKVHLTCEPTDSPMGKMIRDMFNNRIEADHRTIAALFVADRLHHILNKTDGILKMLEEGYTVISDRYYLSSYAYQSPYVGLDWVIQANSLSAGLLRPDLNIYIDIAPEQSIERLEKGRTSTELYETLDNLRDVRGRYLEIIDRLKDEEKILICNGNQSTDAIADELWSSINNMMPDQ